MQKALKRKRIKGSSSGPGVLTKNGRDQHDIVLRENLKSNIDLIINCYSIHIQ